MSNQRRFLATAALGAAVVACAGLSSGADASASGFATGIPLGAPFARTVGRPPDDAVRRACSFWYPVCVHGRPDVTPAALLGTLADAERSWALLTEAVGIPRPLSDGSLGGTASFDIYLVRGDDPALGPEWVMTSRDEPVPGALDRASAFALLRSDLAPGCVRRSLVARAVASATLWGVDAGEDPAVRESFAAYLAELAVPCGSVTSNLIDDFQAHPERAVSSRGGAGPASAMPLPWYIDVMLGSGTPGTLPVALAVLGSQRTPPESFAWQNEPDLFDVLRGVLKTRTPPLALGDWLIEFAEARLFMGSRDDGAHFPGAAFAGSFGRVRFDWSVAFGSLPRRLSPERPIDPTGSTFVWVDLQGAPRGARLVFRMEWEAPVLFRWSLLRIRPDGTEASRVVVVPQQKSTSAERNIDDLDGLAGVAIVGVNTGDLRLDDPFDPDVAPYEPHSYVLTIASP